MGLNWQPFLDLRIVYTEGRRPPDFLLVQKNFLYCLIFPEDFTRGSGRIYKSNYTSRIIELVKEELFGLALVEAI